LAGTVNPLHLATRFSAIGAVVPPGTIAL